MRSTMIRIAPGACLTLALVAGCSMPPEPQSNENSAMDDNGNGAVLPILDACLDDLNARLDSAGDEWQLNMPGSDVPGELNLMSISGAGNRVTLVEIVIADSGTRPGYTTELALDLDVTLTASSFTLITSGLADDGTTTRVFVDGNPATSMCQDDGRLSPRLVDLDLDYSIQFGTNQLVGSVQDAVLR